MLIEALACGTPVVSTDCPHGPSEIMTGSLSDYLVPCGDPNALTNKINQVLCNSADLSRSDILPKVNAISITQQYLALCS